jgi:hypothetical protein
VSRFARLRDLDGCQVADGEPDVRGWHVLTHDNRRAGEVAYLVVDLDTMHVCYLEVELDKDALMLRETRYVLVPIDAALANEDEEIVRVGLTTAALIAIPSYDARHLSGGARAVLRRRYAGSRPRPDRAGRRRRLTGSVETRVR